MHKLTRLTGVVSALALAVTGCNVRLRDTTPAELPANDALGMYEVSAALTRDVLVTPGSVYVFALGDRQRVALSPAADGTHWRGFYSVRCSSSFPLQFVLEWKQLFEVQQQLLPARPRQIRLSEAPQPRELRIDTSGAAPRGGWQGVVRYRFVTAPRVEITGAHIEPVSGAPGDVAAARALAVLTALPLTVSCGDYAELQLSSAAARARGVLVVELDHPSLARWTTQVEFAPK